MKENKLIELSMDFSVDIINLVKYLKIICYHFSLLPFGKRKRASHEVWRIYRTKFYIAMHQYNSFYVKAQANIPFHLLL